MDVGDGFWGVGLGISMLLVTVAELTALSILTLGSFARPERRVYVCLVAMLCVVAAHCAIASSGIGWWRKVFLGRDTAQDLEWLAMGSDHTNDPPIGWLGFNAVCHFVLLLCMVRWYRAAQRVTKAPNR